MFHEMAKHIDIRMHFIRDMIIQGVIVVKKIPTMDNPNMMTKFVLRVKFRHCLDLIVVSSI